jgi:hypothetical protein
LPTYPISFRPRPNPSTVDLSAGDELPRYPITGIAGCCPCAIRGHAAAPPSPATARTTSVQQSEAYADGQSRARWEPPGMSLSSRMGRPLASAEKSANPARPTLRHRRPDYEFNGCPLGSLICQWPLRSPQMTLDSICSPSYPALAPAPLNESSGLARVRGIRLCADGAGRSPRAGN